jgi:epoxyqueuosine reductase
LTHRLKAEAARLGFDALGVAPAVPPPHYPDYLAWLGRGHAAGMGYLERHAALREHPDRLLEGVRSVIVGMFVYGDRSDEPEPGRTQGKVARYALGGDYHDLLWSRLGALLDWLRTASPGVKGRAVADSAPLLERDYAMLAGLGWIGKNTMLLNRRLGSYTVLGALLVDIELAYDEPPASGHCGTCTRCLDACPTGAFVGPYELDSRRCISYWTIEHRGPFPDEIAENLHGWAFGCDICQEVCPWNRKAPPGREATLQPRPGARTPDLIQWLEAEPTEFVRSWKGTALARARRAGLLRNAASLLGSRKATQAVPALRRALDDPDPTVREAAARALLRIGSDDQVDADHDRRGGDEDQQDHQAQPRGVGEDAAPAFVPRGGIDQADRHGEGQDVPVNVDARHAAPSSFSPPLSVPAGAGSPASASSSTCAGPSRAS